MEYIKKSDFSHFLQTCTGGKTKQRWLDLLRQKTEAAVFLYMVLDMDKTNKFIGTGTEIASELKMRKQNVLEAIKALNAQGYIRTDYDKITKKTIHWIDPSLVWRSTPNDRKVCGFIDEPKKRPIYSFNNFVQSCFTRNVKAKYLECLIENPMAYILFQFINITMDYNRNLEVSRKDIADALNVSEKTISRCLSYLVNNDFIYAFKRGKALGFTVDEYLSSRTNNPTDNKSGIILGVERRNLQ